MKTTKETRMTGRLRGLGLTALCAMALVAMAGCGGGGGGGPRADIRGRILLVTTGQPPNPAATVAVAGADAVQTLTDGTFIIRNASADAKQIVVTATGMTKLVQDLPTLTANAVNDLGDVFLTNSTYNADVDGTVLRADTLAPVSGATVRISGKTAVTASDGSFAIKALPVGLGGPDIQIGVVRATGFEDKAIYWDFPFGATTSADTVNHLGNILISPPVGTIPDAPTTIRGKVTLQGETVHTGSTVTLIKLPEGTELGSVLSLSDGSYGFWVPVGKYQIRAEHSGYQTQTVNVLLSKLDQPVTVNITLVP